MIQVFHRSKPELSLILSEIVDDLYLRFCHLLNTLTLPLQALTQFSAAVQQRGAPLATCFGFIDGTVRPICKPIDGQRLFYNGHKRVHALKFQAVAYPNGLIGHLHGPIEGRHHDAFMLAESGLLDQLSQLPRSPEDRAFCLYGDPAYPISEHLINPFRGTDLTDDQQEFNKAMSAVRQSVEWSFDKIITNFAFLDFRKNMKILLQPVGKYYVMGALFTNCHTCLYSSQTSQYFSCDPPSLENYLSGHFY